MTNFSFDIYSTLPEAYLTTSIFVLLIYGVLLSVSQFWGYPLVLSSTGFLSIQVLFFTTLLVLFFPYTSFLTWNFSLTYNFYTFVFKLFVLVLSILWIMYSLNYLTKEKINSFEYWIFILMTILSSFFILSSCDLLLIYLVIELQSLSFYVLASFKRSSEFSTEAGLKYFILGAFSSAFLLFGCSLIYGLTGITNLLDLNLLFSGFILEKSLLAPGVFLGLLFIASALFFKLSSAPFHMWSPDVYEGSPTTSTAFFSLFPKIVILTLLLRIFILTFHDFYFFWKPFFISCGFLSLLFGTLGALYQKKWKRFLAYSSITHVGFILIGFLLGENFSMISCIVYLLIYIITTLAIFSFLIDFRSIEYPQQIQVRYIKDITNFSFNNRVLAGSLVLILFSMAGVPPLAGFFAKFFVILTGIQSGTYSLILFSIIMSSITCFYYIRVIQSMYFIKFKKQPIIVPLNKSNTVILGASCFLLLLFFLDMELFLLLITKMILSFTL